MVLGGFKWDVYLAYPSGDRQWAYALYHALSARGLRVFFDQESLRAGANWQVLLPSHVRSSVVVVFLVSERTATSHYELAEVVAAVEELRRDERRAVVPVRLTASVPLPYGLEAFQALELFDERDVDRVAGQVLDVVPGRALDRGRPTPREVGRRGAGPPRTDAVTVLHLSDPLFGPSSPLVPAGHGSLAALVAIGLAEASEPLLPVDVVVVSGDLTARARPDDFAAVAAFLAELSAALELDLSRVVVVPGNHDVNKVLCRAYFDEQEVYGEVPVAPYARKWEPYRRFVTALHGVESFTPDRPYHLHHYDDLGLVVAAMNSTMDESHLVRHGRCGDAQLAWFAAQLDDYAGWLRVGVVHHDVTCRSGVDGEDLSDAVAFTRALEGRLDLVLHGHAAGLAAATAAGAPALAAGLEATIAHRVANAAEEAGAGGPLGDPAAGAGGPGAGGAGAGGEATHRIQVVRAGPRELTCWGLRYDRGLGRYVAGRGGDGRGVGGGGPLVVARPGRPPGGDGEAGGPGAAEAPTSRLGGPMPADPSFLDEVAAVTELREGVASVRHRSDGPVDYLAVFTPSGEMYPVGVVDGALTTEAFDAFCARVHEPISSRGSVPRSVLVHTGPLDEEWRRRGSRRGLTINTWPEYQNLLDLSSYRAGLAQQVRNDDDYPQDLYLDQQYQEVGRDGAVGGEVLDELAETVIDEVLAEGPRFVLVLGDPGFGKSFLMYRVSHLLLDGSSGVTPIVVLLRDAEKRHGIEEMVAPALARSSSAFQGERFRRMFRNGRIALLIDGYDEFAVRVGYDQAAEQLRTFLGAVEGRAKIVLTTRPNHFRSREQVTSQVFEDVLGLDARQRRIYELEPFDRHQQRAFLVKWFVRAGDPDAAGEADRWMQALAAVDKLPELARTPRMLSFMARRLHLEQLRDAGRGEGPVTAAGLYELLVDTWLAIESSRFGGDGTGTDRHRLDRNQRWQVAEELAYRMWASGEPHVSETLLGEAARATLDLPALGLSMAQAAQEVGSGTLLVGEADRRHFAHQSIGEFLLARRLAALLQARSGRPSCGRRASAS